LVIKNVIPSILKKHKSKVKEHLRRTWYQSIDFEFQTARKDYEDCVLHAIENKVISIEILLSSKTSRCHQDDQNTMMENIEKRVMNWVSKFFDREHFLHCLKDHNIKIDFAKSSITVSLKTSWLRFMLIL